MIVYLAQDQQAALNSGVLTWWWYSFRLFPEVLVLCAFVELKEKQKPSF